MKICLNTLTRGPLQQNYPHITLKIKLQHKWVKLPLLYTICSKKKSSVVQSMMLSLCAVLLLPLVHTIIRLRDVW